MDAVNAVATHTVEHLLDARHTRSVRSSQARVRQAWKMKSAQIAANVEHEIETFEIDATDRSDRPRAMETCEDRVGWIESKATEAALEYLWAEAQIMGLDVNDATHTGRVWETSARGHARDWVARQATRTQWGCAVDWTLDTDRLVDTDRAIDTEQAWGDVRYRSLGRIAEIAQAGIDEALQRAPRWLRRETLAYVPPKHLRQGEAEWRRWLLEEYGRGVGRRTGVTKKQAEEALEHWRWEAVRPPLLIVAMGAGHTAPICTDSAWAHALANERSAKRLMNAQGECAEEWIKDMREGEERAHEEAHKKVRRLAIRALQEWCVNPTTCARMLDQASALWEHDDVLEGDGRTQPPTLAPSPDARHGRMVWTFAVNGPETVLAAGIASGQRGRDVVEANAPEAQTLRVDLDPDVIWAEIESNLRMTLDEDQRRHAKRARTAWDRIEDAVRAHIPTEDRRRKKA